MKKNYVAPKMEVVELKKENMIVTSGCNWDCRTYSCYCHGTPGEEK